MKLKTSQHGGVTVISLQGNLMGGPDASSIISKLHELIDAGKHHVVIDLKAVEFVNSSGLSLLIGGVSTMKAAGGALSCSQMRPRKSPASSPSQSSISSSRCFLRSTPPSASVKKP